MSSESVVRVWRQMIWELGVAVEYSEAELSESVESTSLSRSESRFASFFILLREGGPILNMPEWAEWTEICSLEISNKIRS